MASRDTNQLFYEAIASIYDRLYAEVDAVEAVRQWLSLIAEYDPMLIERQGGRAQPRLLDLGCGTGRYLEPWAAAGFRVTGVDGSIAMIRRARRLKLKSPYSASMNLVHHDLRLRSARLKGLGPFDIAVAHFNFLNLLTLKEVEDFLGEVRQYLSRGSCFITDCAPPDLIPAPGDEFYQLDPSHRIQITSKPNRGNRSVVQTYRWGDRELQERYCFHSTPELIKAARQAGWKMEAAFGWRPDKPECPWSPRRRAKSHRVCVFRV
jgi:SAM-dependent methyltransferase